MAAGAPRKRRQMPGLRTQIEIGHDRRTHRLVLRALPAQVSLTPSLSQVLLQGMQSSRFNGFAGAAFSSALAKPFKTALDTSHWEHRPKAGVNEIGSGEDCPLALSVSQRSISKSVSAFRGAAPSASLSK